VKRRAFFQTGLAAGLVGAGMGDPAALLARPRRQDGGIRLHSNENPLGVGPKARQAVTDELQTGHQYPRALREALTGRLAEHHGVPVEAIVLGAGSTEILRVAVQALGMQADRIVIAEPTFEDSWRYARIAPTPVQALPLRADMSHDVPRMRAAADRADGPVVVFLCNPNNPTGTITPSAEIDEWIAAAPDDHFFLVDEAYFDFVESPAYHTAIRWTGDRRNVLVVRTFSKVYGMAGLRLGYGIAHPELAARFEGWLTRNNGNQLALAAALASLEDRAFVERSLGVNRQARQIAHECLDELGLAYLPSHTNFLMHRIRGDHDAYRERMRTHGLLVGRQFPPMTTYNRLSMGLASEMTQWAETLRMFRREGWV
jgi:histidinol-phosphate aminotransferase